MRFDRTVKVSVADLLINLSAGWFAAAAGIPFLADRVVLLKLLLLTSNIFGGIVCLAIAIWLRRRKK